MKKNTLCGLGTALVTPFLPDGSVDFDALGRLIDCQIAAKVDYLVVLGTTGEAATLSSSEKRGVRAFIVERVARRLPLVVGIGGKNTAAVCTALRMEELNGFDAILSVCPYYNKPNQEGLYQHFCAIADASPLPVILYNVPGRTGVNLLPETVMRIQQAHPEKIIGIKEASGNMEQIRRLIALRDAESPDFMVISGDDALAAALMKAGADGLISVASNAFPADFLRIVHQADDERQTCYAPLIELLFQEGNPTGIKCVLAQQGGIHNVLRLPLVPASDELQQAFRLKLSNR